MFSNNYNKVKYISSSPNDISIPYAKIKKKGGKENKKI